MEGDEGEGKEEKIESKNIEREEENVRVDRNTEIKMKLSQQIILN